MPNEKTPNKNKQAENNIILPANKGLPQINPFCLAKRVARKKTKGKEKCLFMKKQKKQPTI